MRKSNYDKFPSIKMNGMIVTGWDAIRTVLEKTGKTVVAVDLYVGTYEDEIVRELSKGFDTVIDTRTLMKSEEEILSMTQPFMTDDVLFGYLTSLRINDFFNIDKIEETKNIDLNTGKKVLVARGRFLLLLRGRHWSMPIWRDGRFSRDSAGMR